MCSKRGCRCTFVNPAMHDRGKNKLMNDFYSVIFPQVEQPRVHTGNLTTIGISAGIVIFALLTLLLQTRDERIAKRTFTGDETRKSIDTLAKEDDDGSIERGREGTDERSTAAR